MTLIASISGIRGIVGGKPGTGLTPPDIVRFTAAYGHYLRQTRKSDQCHVVVGRDARPSGLMVNKLVTATLQACGIRVTDIGLAPTPTTAFAVQSEKADGGVIITASHNPRKWNALKLLDHNGEFITATAGDKVMTRADKGDFEFVASKALGAVTEQTGYIRKHIERILKLPLVDQAAIAGKKLKVVVDGINSVGGISIPPLLKALGVEEVIELFCKPDGDFAHNPEPLPDHLTALASEVTRYNAHLGIAVDPDADRLAFVCEDGSMFGEEYTLVAIADYVLKHEPGPAVSNLSSTRALEDVAVKHKCKYFASPVGEANVVKKMKMEKAVIGGEGNGGVIYPKVHYGRDALTGTALFLSHLAHTGKTASYLRSRYPTYHMLKQKIPINETMKPDDLLVALREKYKKQPANTDDGVKLFFDKEWVHLRKSNTEPIIRLYAEGESSTTAEAMVNKITQDIQEIMKDSK